MLIINHRDVSEIPAICQSYSNYRVVQSAVKVNSDNFLYAAMNETFAIRPFGISVGILRTDASTTVAT